MQIPLYVNGKVRDLWVLGPEDVDVEDIAHALSQINRFVGRTPEPYSVAQHAVLVSFMVPPELAYCALHHDSAEAFVGDLASTIERHVSGFAELEARIWEQAIAPALTLPQALPALVHAADKAALTYEMRWIQGRLDVRPPLGPTGPLTFWYAWDRDLARLRFLARHRELRPS